MSEACRGRAAGGFSVWLRTGKLPLAFGPDGIELKFNPWHDPTNGRFAFAGSGRHFGAGEAGSSDRPFARRGRTIRARGLIEARSTTSPQAPALRGSSVLGDPAQSVKRVSPAPQIAHKNDMPGDKRSNAVIDFVEGVGEGVSDAGRAAVGGVRAALTTNPVATVANANLGVAKMIDAAIAAEDIPARVQVARAASAVANASARDMGRTTGAVAGNVALSVAPGAALSKVAALRRLRMAAPRATYDPPEIGWVKENIRSDKPWKMYNDTAPGARAGHAPTLVRTMADGSKRPVKFDGIQGDYLIDRKWSISNWPNARAQMLRQSQALAEHRVIGVLEVPTLAQKAKALKQFKKMKITNIYVKVVKL